MCDIYIYIYMRAGSLCKHRLVNVCYMWFDLICALAICTHTRVMSVVQRLAGASAWLAPASQRSPTNAAINHPTPGTFKMSRNSVRSSRLLSSRSWWISSISIQSVHASQNHPCQRTTSDAGLRWRGAHPSQ